MNEDQQPPEEPEEGSDKESEEEEQEPCPDCGQVHPPEMQGLSLGQILMMTGLGGPPSPKGQAHLHAGPHPQVAAMMAHTTERAKMLEQAVQLIAIFRSTNRPIQDALGEFPLEPAKLTPQETSAYNAALQYTTRVFNTEDISPDGTLVMQSRQEPPEETGEGAPCPSFV